MNGAIWIGILVDAFLSIWIVISFREITISTRVSREYLRRIALSLPVNPEQMKLIKRTITTKEAMAMFEKDGGSFQLVNDERRVVFSILMSPEEARESKGANTIEPELLSLLNDRRFDVYKILVQRKRESRS